MIPVIIHVVAGVIFFLMLVSSVTALDWTTETVDSPGDVGYYSSLALDNSGAPHISYMDWTNRHLKYAVKRDGGWFNETADATMAVGEFSSLKLNLNGEPHISYYDPNRGNLSFAAKSGIIWTREVADNEGVGRYTSLGLDGSGNPRICYQDLLNAKLKYAVKTGESWTNETVDNSGNVGAYASLALDRGGNPHISYYDGARGDLKYAVKNGGQWTNQTVDSTGNIGYFTSIALDGTGNPHISYYDGVNRDLKYATKTGSSWVKEIVDSNGSVGSYTSLAIDSSGNPHISYYDSTGGHLKYAVKAGSVWTTNTVDNAANTGMFTSLALDSSGNPRISYQDRGNNDLKYARGIPPLHLNFTVSSQHGSAPLTVRFSDISTGGLPSLWNWSFGDGAWYTTSVTALRNPEHVYETPGTYTVNLTVQNLSVPCTLVRAGFVTVVAPPETTVQTTMPTPTPTPTSSPTPTITPSPTPTLTSSPTPTITSSPTPTLTSPILPAYTSGEGSGSDDDPLPVQTSTPVLPRVGLQGCQSVSVGGDSAISRVTVTGQDVTDIIVTAWKYPSLPSGTPLMDTPVYQYIDVVPSRYTTISAAVIEFAVPLLLIADHQSSVNYVSLCVLMNRTWVCLPADPSGSKNGNILYHAESPEFSLFAITLKNETSSKPPGGAIPGLQVPDKVREYGTGKTTMTVIPEPPPVSMPVASNPVHSLPIFVVVIMIIIGVVLCANALRSWWIRR